MRSPGLSMYFSDPGRTLLRLQFPRHDGQAAEVRSLDHDTLNPAIEISKNLFFEPTSDAISNQLDSLSVNRHLAQNLIMHN